MEYSLANYRVRGGGPFGKNKILFDQGIHRRNHGILTNLFSRIGEGSLENKILFNQGIRRHDQRNSHQGNSRVRGGIFGK